MHGRKGRSQPQTSVCVCVWKWGGGESLCKPALGYPMHRNTLTYRPFNALYAAVTYYNV